MRLRANDWDQRDKPKIKPSAIEPRIIIRQSQVNKKVPNTISQGSDGLDVANASSREE